MLKEVIATRYITPLREGGSLPGLVEADDFGTYVLKFTGAGQGRKTLVAEVVCGELARRLGFRVPRLVAVDLDPVLGLGEPDQQVQELLKSSGGTNLGMEFLSGALGFDPLAFEVSAEEAGRIVWFDALVNNVDRSWRNPNLLRLRGETWLIDHGAALTFHHAWNGAVAQPARPFAPIADHVLLAQATLLAQVDAELAGRLGADVLQGILADVPDEFLALAGAEHAEGPLAQPASHRQAYVDYLLARLAGCRASSGRSSSTLASSSPAKRAASCRRRWRSTRRACWRWTRTRTSTPCAATWRPSWPSARASRVAGPLRACLTGRASTG